MWFWQTRRNWGHTAIGLWLIATGLLSLVPISIPYGATILAALAVVAGILILMGR